MQGTFKNKNKGTLQEKCYETQRNISIAQPKLPSSVQYTVQKKNKVSFPALIVFSQKNTEACMIVI